MTEIVFIQALVIGCGTVAFVATLGFVRRYLELKQERRALPPVDDLMARVERIEQTVESTAIEVERISEANRFLSKLLAERAGPPAPPASPPRVITPH